MTQEEKQLLLKDLCARLPYGVWVECCDVSSRLDNIWLAHFYNSGNEVVDVNGNTDFFHDDDYFDITKIKPYLRPMSSMTEEEAIELCTGVHDKVLRITEKNHTCILSIDQIDWFNTRHFDYRGLIDMGLALEAPEGMYETKTV